MAYIRESGMTLTLMSCIGDKMGGETSVVYFNDPTELNIALNSFIVNVPFKLFHVIRNPFNNIDNIATIVLYEHIRFQDNKIAVIKSINETLRLNLEQIYSAINYFFLRYQAAEDIKQRFNLWTQRKYITKTVCLFGCFCSDEYHF